MTRRQPRKIVAFAGGVGGGRFSRGLRVAAPDAALTIIVNTGDDMTLHGLRICPDIDTVLYTLAGLVHEKRGWGRKDDSFRALETLVELRGDVWFQLGDRDLALHMRRTGLLAAGWPLSRVTAEIAEGLEVRGVTVLPMTDDAVETWIELAEEDTWVHLQEYFVKRRFAVPISGIRFKGTEGAAAGPGVVEAIKSADLLVLCPSNPLISLQPIFAVPGVVDAVCRVHDAGVPVAGVSPLIGGATVKGPAARMLAELGHEPSATGVAAIFSGLLDVFLIAHEDSELAPAIERMGVRALVTDILMRGRRGEARLARELLRNVVVP